MDDPETRSLEERLHEAQECALRLDQSREELFSRLRDAEDARKAAVGIIEKQNAELADVRYERRSMAERAGKAQATLASVRALHCDLGSGVCEECSAPLRYPFLPVPYPCRTVKALNA